MAKKMAGSPIKQTQGLPQKPVQVDQPVHAERGEGDVTQPVVSVVNADAIKRVLPLKQEAGGRQQNVTDRGEESIAKVEGIDPPVTLRLNTGWEAEPKHQQVLQGQGASQVKSQGTSQSQSQVDGQFGGQAAGQATSQAVDQLGQVGQARKQEKQSMADHQLKEVGLNPQHKAQAQSQSASVPLRLLTFHPLSCSMALLCADAVALIAAQTVALYGRWAIFGRWWEGSGNDLNDYMRRFWPILGLFLGVFACTKLFRVAANPAAEMRRLVIASVLVFLAVGTLTFLTGSEFAYSRSVFLSFGVLSILFLLMGRAAVRALLSRRRWWGYPVVVLGGGRQARRVTRSLIRRPELGLRPVAMLADQPWHEHGCRGFPGVPMMGGTDLALRLAKENPRLRLLVVAGELEESQLQRIIQPERQAARNVILVAEDHGSRAADVSTNDIAGFLAMEFRHRLMQPGHLLMKRGIDLGLVFLFAPLWAPLLGFLAVLVKLTSPGPMFFGHKRIGRDGQSIKVWKLRTMVRDAQQVLEDHLSRDPKLRQQWVRDQKLKNDPRITKIGNFLRRSSLDELPQLWNVITGDLSLVGPRPIIQDEVARYGQDFNCYLQVRPGLTGMWQVSGRNSVSYVDRVRLDVYYVRNWSVWLDLYILFRTPYALLFQRGAM